MVNPKIEAYFEDGYVLTENSDAARDLYAQSVFGKIVRESKVQLALIEALYLVEKNKIIVLDGRNKEIDFDGLLKKSKKYEKNILTKYAVYKDMRDRGYVVKTALKFGADFRVYDRGIKPGEDHAKWVLYPVRENEVNTWHEFSSKNRVAHSTKKRLLIGVVDEEQDTTYYEIKWTRP